MKQRIRHKAADVNDNLRSTTLDSFPMPHLPLLNHHNINPQSHSALKMNNSTDEWIAMFTSFLFPFGSFSLNRENVSKRRTKCCHRP